LQQRTPAKAARRLAHESAGGYQTEVKVKAPFDCPKKTVRVLGKEHKAVAYKPQFAIGLICVDEREQQRVHARLSRMFPSKDVKVLVI
jgi:hypothetical protein